MKKSRKPGKRRIKRITMNEWLTLKPYLNQTATDRFYLQLCNKVKDVFTKQDYTLLLNYIDKPMIDMMICFLVSYFEDIISETNIWNTFVKKHMELYGKPLPFYPEDDYKFGEINDQDISFLIWYYLNTIQHNNYIYPYNEFIYYLSLKIMVIFNEEYYHAPENEELNEHYFVEEDETDFYKVRGYIDHILFSSYLFITDTLVNLQESEDELLNDQDENTLNYLNENRDSMLHRSCTKLLAMRGKELAAEILGKSHPLYDDLYKMSNKISGLFLYKGQNESHIILEHIASDKRFNLLKASFDTHYLLKEIDTVVFIGIVRWKDEWWFSGVSSQFEYNADVILNEKNSMKSRMAISTLDYDRKEYRETLQKQKSAFLSFNNGSLIAFLSSEKIKKFYEDYIAYFNNFLKLSKKEQKEAQDRIKKKGFFGDEEKNEIDFSERAESGLVFFNSNSGIEIALSINSAFPDKNNAYFDMEESEEAINFLFMSKDFSRELAQYCVDNYKNDLPFFKSKKGKSLLKDIDFLLRFWKAADYHSRPQLTLI